MQDPWRARRTGAHRAGIEGSRLYRWQSAHCPLKLMIHAVFAGAQVDVAECGGLCSYYAEQGGLMVGFEDGEAEA